jgi:hypothetical protein
MFYSGRSLDAFPLLKLILQKSLFPVDSEKLHLEEVEAEKFLKLET